MFEIYKRHHQLGKTQWYWRFRNRNNRIMADSGEGYNTRHGCRKSLHRFIDIVRMPGGDTIRYTELD